MALTTQQRLDAIRAAIDAQASAGGVVKVREVDGREVAYDLAWAREEEARLQRQLDAEKAQHRSGGLFQRLRFKRPGG